MSRNVTLSDEQSRLNARLEAHMVYICPECGKAFRTQVEWRQHLNTKHEYLKKTYSDFNFIQIDERFHECQLCFKWVENAHKTIALLQYHYFMHLEHSETYRCVHCRMAYTRRRALNTHLLDTHLREIEKYETKLRQMKRQQQQDKESTAGPAAAAPANANALPHVNVPAKRGRPRGSGPKQRKDLLQKALMDIDLHTEVDKSPTAAAQATAGSSGSVSSVASKTNASEQNLDRCLDAYEDIVRKEEGKQPKFEAELDALCQQFFDESTPAGKEKREDRSTEEVVLIEIDALGKEEVAKLKKEMKSDSQSQAAKRRRISASPNRDSDSEVSTNGLMKLISYLCPKCGKEIASMEGWRAHVFNKHDFEHIIENSFKIQEPGHQAVCLQCHEVQPSTKRSQLQKHCFKHLPYRSYLKCSLCDRTKTSTSKILNHIRYNHQDELRRKNKTQLIIKPEPKWPSPGRQSNKHSVGDYSGEEDGDGMNGESMVCEHCDMSFKTKWRYDRHVPSCRRAGVIPESGFEAMLSHLREGSRRIEAIWKTMNTEKV
ncbi:uncharacterized protein Dana_GF16656 [Drosophila ananassae]|uniref:C2H2-type domain-containing protein n=1 Tax=Drosophila ananassae TaxID=7217 RepID=B3M0H1_DROAN|nr:uncharacterized protein LOC6499450 [Drosophila ananassae]EDV43177.1 uncharacterized protein Dana_GF16656 [Drosophila ananassae]